MGKQIIGKEEWVGLPDLALPFIKARVDSGAKTSSLHAFNIRPYKSKGEDWVRFDVHPIQKTQKVSVQCRAKLVEYREVKSSSGHVERRPVIATTLRLGDSSWTIRVTLTNRDSMGFRMLLGREAMEGRVLVDPEMSFRMSHLSDSEARHRYTTQGAPKRGLQIAVLASNPELYSNRRLMEAGRQRGHTMHFVAIEQCFMNISAGDPQIYYRGGEALPIFDAVIPRIRPAVTFYGTAVLRQFQLMNSFCLNDSVSISRSRDKLRSLQMMSNKGIPMPVTSFAHSPLDTEHLIEMVGGAPVVVKLLEGTQGRGVVLAETGKAAESVINAFKSLKANILVQEFVREAAGCDLRLFVIDDKVVGAMERVAAKGEFRANLHRGGSARLVRITPEERRIAIASARAMGLQVAGVDIIRSGTGPKVLEVNSSPGLEGIETITGKDIAGMMMACIEKYATRKRRKSAG